VEIRGVFDTTHRMGFWLTEEKSLQSRRHPWTMPAMANVNAHITGTVWKIEVKEGDTVTEGQTCVILESMKMEMPVEAPQAGKVEKISCAEGQAVNEGDVLLTIA
jgi:acetyl-CoA carboxylase biotin carboxyl carrier protein